MDVAVLVAGCHIRQDISIAGTVGEAVGSQIKFALVGGAVMNGPVQANSNHLAVFAGKDESACLLHVARTAVEFADMTIEASIVEAAFEHIAVEGSDVDLPVIAGSHAGDVIKLRPVAVGIVGSHELVSDVAVAKADGMTDLMAGDSSHVDFPRIVDISIDPSLGVVEVNVSIFRRKRVSKEGSLAVEWFMESMQASGKGDLNLGGMVLRDTLEDQGDNSRPLLERFPYDALLDMSWQLLVKLLNRYFTIACCQISPKGA